MKIDDKLTLGLLVGVIVGLHYGTALITYMPFFVIIAGFLVLRKVK